MSELRRLGPALYELPKTEGMRVPGLVVATDELLGQMEVEKPLQQVANVAYLPGIVGYSIAMPDMHWGYGFPIGGVAAMDLEEGVISPGGVGYDINCGVRLALAPLSFQDLSERSRELLIKRLFALVPSGVGQGHGKRHSLRQKDYQSSTERGARWSVEQGFGFAEDLEHTESYGYISGGALSDVSVHACNRGKEQLGSVGSGNHFVEVGEVQDLFDPQVAEDWDVSTGQMYILIHSGSRGFGHQICQDTLNHYVRQGLAEGLPDKQLVAAKIASADGQKYLSAMSVAANYAFNNRQQILHWVRHALLDVCGIQPEEVRLLYDVCHNIAKVESHTVDGKSRKLCVHRKGATRAFGPGAEELIPLFQKTGQPVMVPGDMGRASHIMVGCGHPLTWSSSCHGAGRARSRHASKKAWQGRDALRYMRDNDVTVLAHSTRTIVEEMPDAYKDVDEVVEAVEQAGLARKVARLKPRLVIKG